MARLIFECPRTRRQIDAGIETDSFSLAAVRPVKLWLYCSHCRKNHKLPIHCAHLIESWTPELGGRDTPKEPRLSIAINALRISLLASGLTKQKADGAESITARVVDALTD
jgi:hypothetical protein